MSDRTRIILLALAVIIGLLAGCAKGKHKPGLPELTPKTREALIQYLQERTAMAQNTGAANLELREKNRNSFHECLEKNKNEDCRFMLCSPYALYTGDEFFKAGQLDDAFTFYTGAYNLLKEEIANTTSRRNQRRTDYQALSATGKTSDEDQRQYQFRMAILSHNLYRNYTEMARIIFRWGLIFEKEKKTEEAGDARKMADAFLQAASDAYQDYFTARQAIAPLLNPDDPAQQSQYITTILEMDGLLELQRI